MTFLRLAAVGLLSLPVAAQAVPEQSTTHFVGIDSGYVANTAGSSATIGIPQVVWSTVVTVPNSSWLRLQYEGVLLAGSKNPGSDGSFLRMTSMHDGAVQTQHLRHIGEWRDTSAYFNGDSVLVELMAHAGTGDNRLMIRNAIAGPSAPDETDSICGTVDDRVLSFDNRAARNQPSGCTSWMINDCNHCFLTAGHCTGGLQSIEFNVPLSTSGGGEQHPPPSDQYAVDLSSLQDNGGQGVGDDWAYFGVFPNSNTNLTPFQAYGGQAFDLVPPPAVSGQNIRITGFGTTSSPVSPTWNVVQKTHSGPYFSYSAGGNNSTIQYTTDTTGGNSGSPVIIDGTNLAIGIHTHAGCNTVGGNQGTGSDLPALQNALANPLGICNCPAVEFTFPNGLPESVDPNGNTTIRVAIGGPVPLQAGTFEMQFANGGPFQSVAPVMVNATTFDVTVPSNTCGTLTSFYFTAQGTDGLTYTNPIDAPATVYTRTSTLGSNIVRDYDFNTGPAGWSVVNSSLATGAWIRGTPVDSRGPSSDFDGSGQCYVTGNVDQEDVDGGPTQLITETVDLSSEPAPVVSYAIWFDSTGSDVLTISASNNGGASWTVVETVTGTNGWETRVVNVLSLFASPGQFAMRFSTEDQPNNSVTEAALDAFRIESALCSQATWTTYGTGCTSGGSAPSLQLVSLPDLGSSFDTQVNGLAGGATAMIIGLSSTSVPLPTPLFAAGCTQLAAADVLVVLNAVGGSASFSLPIPNDPSLAGSQVFEQAIEFGASWTLSAGGVGEIH